MQEQHWALVSSNRNGKKLTQRLLSPSSCLMIEVSSMRCIIHVLSLKIKLRELL